MRKNGPRSRVFLLVFLASYALIFGAGRAQASSDGHCKELLVAQEKPTVDPLSPQSPDPASNPPVTQAKTDTERYTLSHERYEKAVAYSRAGYTLYFISIFFQIGVLLLFLRLGIAAKFRDFAERLTETRILQGLIFIPVLILSLDVLELPVHLYWHSLSLRYQQSVQGWSSWLLDWVKEESLVASITVGLGLLLFWLIRKSPRRWWFYFWVLALPILLFVFFISPWFVDPLFNKFEPLDKTNPELVTAIEKVTERAGLAIPRDKMFLMRASEKTNQINAYVTGFGASKRVVVWDNTIKKTTQNETLFIFGHEAGHYVLNHLRNGFLFFSMSFLISLYLAYRLLDAMLARWGASWKVYGPQDWVSLVILLLIFEMLMFAGMPITNAFTRDQEHNADLYGLEVIHGIVPNSGEVAAHAFQVLGEEDLADPNPPSFITFWLYSHPPLAERLVFVHTYDPWSKKEPPKYVK